MNGAHDKYKKAKKIAKEFSRSLRIRIVDRHEEGADKFPNDKFDFAHWTRKTCVTVAEVGELLHPAKLVGRKIWDVHCGAIFAPDQQTILSDADKWRYEFLDFHKGACREYVKLPNSLRIKRTLITGVCVVEFEDGGSLEIASNCYCELEDDDVWPTQDHLARLYNTSKQNVSQHVKSIFESGELDAETKVKKFFTMGKKDGQVAEFEIYRAREMRQLKSDFDKAIRGYLPGMDENSKGKDGLK